MECLGEMIWASQRSGLPPDGLAYIDGVRRRATRSTRDRLAAEVSGAVLRRSRNQPAWSVRQSRARAGRDASLRRSAALTALRCSVPWPRGRQLAGRGSGSGVQQRDKSRPEARARFVSLLTSLAPQRLRVFRPCPKGASRKRPDLGAKRRHSSGYGEHLQRRAGVFWRARRAWRKDSSLSEAHRSLPGPGFVAALFVLGRKQARP